MLQWGTNLAERRLSAERSKVMLVFFTSFGCGYCVTQFAILSEMLNDWRREGYGREALEIWAIGYPAPEEVISRFAAGTESACLVDGTAAVFGSFGAAIDDLFVIDQAGMVAYEKVNLISHSLANPANRALLDTRVRSLL